MAKEQPAKALRGLTKELVEVTQERDKYAIDYELELARTYFSDEVNGLSNQVMRDKQATISMNEKSMYRKMGELKSDARLAWYKWAAIKSLVDGTSKE